MLSALSYNKETGFLLKKSITEFLNKLNIYNFEDLKRDTILNCISNHVNNVPSKIYLDIKIETLIKIKGQRSNFEKYCLLLAIENCHNKKNIR
jgi:hypothetical protein